MIKLFLTAFFGLTAITAQASEPQAAPAPSLTEPRLAVVLISNFSCPVSYKFEGYVQALKQELDQRKIRFSTGFLPAMAQDGSLPTWARERAYYALRDAGHEKAARRIIFDAVQNLKLPLDTDSDVLSALTAQADLPIDMDQLAVWMQPGTPAELSVVKAIQHMQWADETPTIVFFRNARKVFQISSKSTGGDLTKLYDDVVGRLDKFKAGEF